MHFLIAFVLALIVVVGFGQHDEQHQGERARAVAREADTRPQLAGLKAGDTIVSVDGKTFATPTALTDVVAALHRQAVARWGWSGTAG